MESLEEKLKECRDDGEAMQLISSYLEGIFDKESSSPLKRREAPQTVSVQSLINEAYIKYGFITSVAIERLRLRHRLQVVHQLEHGLEKTIVRSLLPCGYFKVEELEVRALHEKMNPFVIVLT